MFPSSLAVSHNAVSICMRYWQVAQLSQRDRAVGWVSYGQKWKTGTGGTIFYGHYRSTFNHCDVIGQQSNRIRWKKTQNKGYHAVQGHSRVIAAYCSNFGHCFFDPPWELRDNVRCSSWAHWKPRSGLPISVSWTFFLVLRLRRYEQK